MTAGGVATCLRTRLCAPDISGMFSLVSALVMALGRYYRVSIVFIVLI